LWLFLKNLAFTLVMPGSVAVWVPLWIAARAGRSPADAWTGAHRLAALPLALGAAIYFWCLWDFATFGRGTPAPIDAPKRLVARGLYRVVRNPMYLGVLTVIAGWWALFGLPLLWQYGAAVAAGFQVFVLVVEEPSLRRQFGGDYARYCDAVRRWLPGTPWRGESG
jgi:protein-S-isoprenylcysteine O-methyltransferase Ste14